MTAGMDNIIHAGNTKTVEGFGTNYGINARSGSAVTLDAGNQNAVLGAVFASRSADDAMTNVTLDGASNVVQSAAAIANAGGLNDGKEVISSLYAEHGAQLSLSGDQNVIRTYADNTNENQLERTVWAYETADITIDGQTYISTDRYETSPNSLDIAVAAGTATDLKEDKVNAPVADRATVNINYDSYTDGDGNTIQSSIEGDILSAYAGEVNITPKSDTAKIDIKGNILAGNNGVLNVNLGNGGTLTGRADDYGDAGVVDNSGHGTSFFNPAFSSKILKGGEVNLTMGEGSKWKVTGQSWITTVDTTGSSNAIIDLVSSNTDKNSSAHALTIYDMKGDAEFKMSLDADRSISDMVYMKHADGSYVVNVIDPVTQQDMYADRSEGGIFDGLRFATVGKGSKATFRAVTLDGGINNIEYEVGTDSYDTSNENHHYDSSTGDGVGNTEKPGTDLVEGFFGSDGTPGAPEAPANGIMMMAARADESLGTNTDANGTEVDETTNFKLIGIKSSEISDAGKTVVAMSRVNYSNAVYMDRLNKRMGEARYIDGDEGLWVRMRHDRIGKSDAFRSMNTMMELGYDTRVNDREDGEHRQGVAIDYMRGTADYKNVAGEGDVRRGGIWFYDTWLGNKGHYTDYVLKFGRLSNDFELYTRTLGEKVTGDYSNFVYSASAEYGRKKDLGNNWYIEPQAQIQYAHVTDADYTTSQDTHVQLDAIDSLIGRVGFRLGKDVGEKSTFYIKADVLHEFLGDQDIEARDATGLLSTTYENEGTWYDIGLGFSHQFSKGTYMYLDMEKSIGNDNEDTYQFNFGMNWKV
ncbi:autotransporter outer membrane beta-barrel domain-containing protein [Megasphaera sp. ASD88]|uniref:autotransporter outer membrane beta-barrel domain-containing protein n=1 Tax=Megasphaera sp. ASD88 TaxID=2027407 RepID=UPI00130430AB|nr:autotransporter outer membrane beta-barrel domain-containing protein [Megasphaera sp. ASD88]